MVVLEEPTERKAKVTLAAKWERVAKRLEAAGLQVDSIEQNVVEQGFELDSPAYLRECIGQAAAELDAQN